MGVRSLFDLTGRVALVTGGSRGLGLQMAEALGEMGARVVVTARKEGELVEAVSHLRSQGVDAGYQVCDLSQWDQIGPMVDRVLAEYGQVDILVNNAGATWGCPAEDLPLEAWLKVVNLNLTGTFLVTQAVGKRSMIPRRKGRIINIASVAGLQGSPPEVMKTLPYNTTKGGLVNFTRALAAEWGPYGITVNAIAPGFFPTRMTRVTLQSHGDQIRQRAPIARLGGEEDLKGAVVLFASDASAYITGQVLAVDGGATIV